MAKQSTLDFHDPAYRDSRRKFCQKCWPKRSKAQKFGVFGYEALCWNCFTEKSPEHL